MSRKDGGNSSAAADIARAAVLAALEEEEEVSEVSSVSNVSVGAVSDDAAVPEGHVKESDTFDDDPSSPSVSSLRRRRGAVKMKNASTDDLHRIVGARHNSQKDESSSGVKSLKSRRTKKKGSWLGFKNVVDDRHRRKAYKHRIKIEFDSECFMREITAQTISAGARKTNIVQDSLHAIYVLGPSAAGKSYGLRTNLGKMLELAKWDKNLVFHPIDGGVMRERSKLWGEMKSLRLGATSECGEYVADGIGDLYKTYFKPHIGVCKGRMFDRLVSNRKNVIIPDTATAFLRDKTLVKIRKLHAAGYEVMMCAIIASKGKCEHNGNTRQLNEGKKYSSRGWSRAMSKVQSIINTSRESGINPELPAVIINNDDWGNVTCEILKPHHLMTWSNVVTKEWPQTREADYVDATKGTSVSHPNPLFTQRSMRMVSSSPRSSSDKVSTQSGRRKSSFGISWRLSWKKTMKEKQAEVSIDDLLDAQKALEEKRAASVAAPGAVEKRGTGASKAGPDKDDFDSDAEYDPSLLLKV